MTVDVRLLLTSVQDEWLTPLLYVEKGRRVLCPEGGPIGCDPASTAYANQRIGARVYYYRGYDGLSQDWRGTVWLNPPFGRLCRRFVARLLEQHACGNTTAAIVLLNTAALQTHWGAPLLRFLICLKHSPRIQFELP